MRITRHEAQGPHGPVPVRVYRADAGTGAGVDTGSLTGIGFVWVHGGGFVAGSLDDPEADWVSRQLAERGATVVSVDYRLCGNGVHYPVPSDDVLAALDWAAAAANELGFERGRLALGGASAGANLAAGVALRMNAQARADAASASPRVKALFLAYPTVHAVQPATPAALTLLLEQLPDPTRFGPAAVRAMYEGYLGGPVEAADSIAVPGSASIDELRGLPPVLIINGESDELRVSGEAFANALAAAGVAVEQFLEPETTHGHLNRPELAPAARSLSRIAQWLSATITPRNATTRTPRPEGTPS
jgi:acetyl esterase/lipase